MKHLPDQVAESLGQPKPWWLSKTIISALATIIAAAVGIAEIAIDKELINEIVTLVLVIVFAGVSIYGRFVANQPVSLSKPAKMPTSADDQDRTNKQPERHGFGEID